MSETPAPKMGYDPALIPKPETNHDAYMYATLIEMRLIRLAVQQLAVALQQTDQATTTKKK